MSEKLIKIVLNLKLCTYNEGYRKDWKIRCFNRRRYFFGGPLMAFFILHLFYLSSHIALIGYTFGIFGHWLRNSLLVPVSCWATIRNINSAYKLIRADFTEDKIKNDKNDACLISFLTILGLLTLHDRYNICILLENKWCISSRCGTVQINSYNARVSSQF